MDRSSVDIDENQASLRRSTTFNIDDLASRNTVNRADIDSILSRYNFDSATVQHNNKMNSYPTPSILTEKLPTNPTTQAQVLSIATNQAKVTNGAVGHTTEYDRNITHYFNKQTRISQTIANLLNIIRKGTANRDQAKNNIETYRNEYNKAVKDYEAVSLEISHR